MLLNIYYYRFSEHFDLLISDTKQTYPPPIAIKPAESSWECPTCMIRNKDSLQKCAACEEPKPPGTTTKTVPKVTTDTGMFTASSVNSFNSKASWTCSTCLITNKEEVSKIDKNYFFVKIKDVIYLLQKSLKMFFYLSSVHQMCGL